MTTNNSQFYGINKGSAQVINTDGVLGQFGQMLAKQQAQRQLELKQLTDQQAQLKPDGLRNDADRKDFFSQANDWKQKKIAAMNERDPYKKSLLNSQADQSFMQAQSTVSQSKQQAAKDLAFNQFAMNDATRHQLTDDAVTKGLANAEVGVNDPRLIKEYSSLGRQVDHKKIIDQLDAADKDALKQSPWGTPTIKNMTVAGRQAAFINNSRTLDPKDRAQMFSQMYDTNRDFPKFFNDVYPQIYNNPNLSPEQQKQAAIGQYIKDSGDVSEYSAPQEKAGLAPDKFYAHYNYELAHPKANAAQTNAPTPIQHNYVAPIVDQGMPAVDKFIRLAPKTQFREGEAPVIKDNNGYIDITMPDQVELKKNGQDIIKANKQAKKDYEDAGGKEGGFLGIGAKKTPWEQSDTKKDLDLNEDNNPYKVLKPGQNITLDRSDPIDLNAKAAALARDYKIPVEQINSMAGGKGKHGLNQDIQRQLSTATKASYQHVQQAKDSKGNTVNLGLKNGKWYNTATNQPVE